MKITWTVASLVSIVCVYPLFANDIESKRQVNVSSVEELYSAINNPLNVNTEIVLAPGTYRLSHIDGNGRARPNGGRLELPAGADLRGANRYREDEEAEGMSADGEFIFAAPDTETIIDAAALPLTSFQIPPAKTGVIRIGRNNVLSHLTVRKNTFALALVEIDLLPSAPGGMNATVRKCILEYGDVGVDFRHFLAEGSGRDSQALVEGNVLRHNLGPTKGMGIRLINNERVQGSTLRITIRKNRLSDNAFGLHAEALGSSDHHIVIHSQDNTYEDNGTGIGLEGGSSLTTAASSRNGLDFMSDNDAIWNNNKGPFFAFQVSGGVVIRAGLSGGTGQGEISDNNALVIFDEPRFVKRTGGGALDGAQNRNGTKRLDVAIYGAYGVFGTFLGKRNRAAITIRDGDTADAFNAFVAIDAKPADPPGTAMRDRNRAVVVASNIPFVDGAGVPIGMDASD